MISFFKWYYRTQTTNLIGSLMGVFAMVSEIFAIQIMIKHLFEPLYQDYTYSGRAIGFLIRGGRIIIGAIVELILLIVLGLVLILWVLLPVIIVFKIIYIFFTIWS
ncbi:MAG: hypothetical protein WC570_03090 [Patescibacteria group bacterium]